MLELVDVTKSFGGPRVLDGLTCRFEASRVHAVLGSSGGGKSTVLKLALGLILPDSGEVRVFGRSILAQDRRALRQRIGYVIQEGGLFPHMTVADNVTLSGRLAGLPLDSWPDRLRELLPLVHLDESFLARYPSELSGGQRQRVALLRALFANPSALLLDEPLGALDPIHRARLQEELRALFRRFEKTVVLVTHDVAEAAYLADRIHVVDRGRVVQSGTIDELVDAPGTPFVREILGAARTTPALMRLGAP
ncbi:MAG: ATP-binding cassette domain-containing protein [Deltaproteobacteria bacterium]|nr:ATP-binding cassette domain-containing protein [Deltaproteobacteria bacterium]